MGLLLASCGTSQPSYVASTVRVGPGHQFTSIQAAINASPAGTIFNIAAGTYHESIIPKNGDVFNGVAEGLTILDGQGTLAFGFDGKPNEHGLGGSYTSDVTVANMTIRGFACDGISTPGGSMVTGWKVLNDDIYGMKRWGIEMSSNMLIQGSRIHDNRLSGINSSATGGAVIDNNRIYNNNASHINPFGASSNDAGTKFSGDHDLTITNNVVYNNYGAGLWSDEKGYNMTISGNEIYGNWVPAGVGAGGGIGIFIEIDLPQGINKAEPTVHIFNNYIHDQREGMSGSVDGTGLWIANSGNVDVHENAFADNHRAISIADEGDRGLAPNGLPYLNANNNIHDNWIATGDGQFAALPFDRGFNNWKAQHNHWNNNVYYLISNSQRAFRDGRKQMTSAQWQALVTDQPHPDSTATFAYNGGVLPAGAGPRGGFVASRRTGAGPAPALTSRKAGDFVRTEAKLVRSADAVGATALARDGGAGQQPSKCGR